MNIYVMSHQDFNTMCETNEWNDANVETLTDKAFISIIGTKDCMDLLEIENNKHWFENNHPNVLNLDFDDTPRDIIYKGVNVKTMSEEQAKETIEFIQNNIGKEFYIHCLAGISRSGAICHWISSNFEEYKDCEKNNEHIRPNIGVVQKLNEIFKSKVD